MAKITVITVCYNAEKVLTRTLESIVGQTFGDFEYILIDGASKDNTLGIALNYKSQFESKGVNFKVASERDSGIYDAMNKGIKLSCGEWLIFINAGDMLCSRFVLETFARHLESADIIYGDTIYSFDGLYKYTEAGNVDSKSLSKAMPFSHQSVFIFRDIMKKYMYDTTYRVVADYDFFLKCFIHNSIFKHVNLPVAIFELDGISNNNTYGIITDIEKCRVRYQNGIIDEIQYKNDVRKLNKKRRSIKNFVRKILPESLQNLKKKSRLKKEGYSRNLPETSETYYKIENK